MTILNKYYPKQRTGIVHLVRTSMGKKGKRKGKKKKGAASEGTGTKAPPPAPPAAAEEQRAPAAGDQSAALAEMLSHLAPLPLSHFSAILRGALLPNERVVDLNSWKHDGALRESVRSMYMRKRLRVDSAHAKLERTLQARTGEWWTAAAAAAERGSGGASVEAFMAQWLLTRSEVVALFGIGSRFGVRGSEQPWLRATEQASLRRQQRLVAEVRMRGGSTTAWRFEDVLEAGGCNVHGLSSFNLCCEDAGIYEFLTVESVVSLARYLAARAAAMGDADGSGAPITVLEVGAGSGRLTMLLNAALVLIARGAGESGAPPLRVVATDSDLRPHPRQKLSTAAAPASVDEDATPLVDEVDYVTAMERHRPAIVLCAWMPMDTDWTHTFRAASSVQEYVMVGEADWGVCGHNWSTWGNSRFRDDVGDDGGATFALPGDGGTPPPHVVDNFERVDLHDEVSRWLLGRYDTADVGGTSVCVSFRRS